MSSGIAGILDTFSLNQLRDLSFAMSSRGLQIPKKNLNKEQLVEHLKKRTGDSQLHLFAHRIEAITPYKHLFVYTIDASLSLSRIKTDIESAFPNLTGSIRNGQPTTDELEPETCLVDESNHRVYLKLAHQVEMSGWVSISRTEKKLQEFRRRHPVVITFRPKERLLTIGFPGFTYVQGTQHESRITYSDIAAQGVAFLKAKLRVVCTAFNAKPAIDTLLEEEPEEVEDIKRNVRPQKGGRFGFDAGEESKVTTALTDFLNNEGGIRVSEKQIRTLLRKTGASDVVLVWKRLHILTRVALLHDGPEFLFVWRDSGPSSSVIDTVLAKVAGYERLLTKPDIATIRKQILSTPYDEVLRPALLAQEHNLSLGEVIETLNLAVAKGDFEPRFRVNTQNLLMDFKNTWRKTLNEFPPSVRDDHEEKIDLTIPSNIEVAFKRIR